MTRLTAQETAKRIVASLSDDGEMIDPRVALEALLLATSAIISARTVDPVSAAGWYAQALVLHVDARPEVVQ